AGESAKNLVKKYKLKNISCFNCPLRCREVFKISDDETAIIMPCQGIWLAINAFTKVENYHFMLRFYKICEENGLDVSSAASVIALAIDSYQKKWISKKETKGLELKWGDEESILTLLNQIIQRKNFGNILAEGSFRAAKQIGKLALKSIGHSKGLPIIVHEFRHMKAFAVGIAVGDVGTAKRSVSSLEVEAVFDSETAVKKGIRLFNSKNAGKLGVYENKAPTIKYYENMDVIFDIMGSCLNSSEHFRGPIDVDTLAQAYSLVYQTKITKHDLEEIANKIQTLSRLYSMREGRTKEDDTVSEKFFNTKIENGPNAGAVLHKDKFEKLKSEYYTERGWDPLTSIPTNKTIKKHNLEFTLTDITKYIKKN
ncbi:MAG: aldehyde ferredoxin oxidoreductase C-terminal domain-containing protein, partial [Candidatus Ranarchaeia archaeon]